MAELKKCIVLDLDNTLWGGIVGEDGKDGLALSHKGSGASFVAFQQALKDMHDRGILLAINSQNNAEDAWDVIRTHPNMILKEKDFAAARINWEDKVTNMRELAKELNIGLNSMVFFDDSPLNREAVRAFLPEVEVPEISDSAEFAKILHSLPYFPTGATTDEDKMRGNMYVTERLRMEAEKGFENREDFLSSLGLELSVSRNDASALARLSQLTEKTNQFNTNKKPKTIEELQALVEDDCYEVYHARLTDRFGDHGIIALALIEKDGSNWHIDPMLMSCRVFGRGVEHALLHVVASHAKEEGAKTLSIFFEPTEKNDPAKTFVEEMFVDKKTSVHSPEAPKWITVRA